MYNLAACIKGALELQGYAVGAPVPPQAPLPPGGVAEVARALVAIGALPDTVGIETRGRGAAPTRA